jgi:hypothetical protein
MDEGFVAAEGVKALLAKLQFTVTMPQPLPCHRRSNFEWAVQNSGSVLDGIMGPGGSFTTS